MRPTPTPRRILTVCLGNHCRSPLAAVVLAELGGSGVEVRSAGLADKHVGKPADPAMVAVAAGFGYDLTAHRGLQITPGLLAWADTVLAMDRANLAALQALVDEATAPKLALYLGEEEVPDPYGGAPEVFTACLRLIEEGARRHLPATARGPAHVRPDSASSA